MKGSIYCGRRRKNEEEEEEEEEEVSVVIGNGKAYTFINWAF